MAHQALPNSTVFSKVGMGEAVSSYRILHFPGQPEYARAVFLNDEIPTPQPVRRKLGKRLYAQDPSDRRVLHVLVQVTNRGTTEEARAESIRLADELISKWPNYSKGYAVRAGVYDCSFFTDHKRKADGEMALKCYQEYLEHSKVTDALRKKVLERIGYIESDLKKLKP